MVTETNRQVASAGQSLTNRQVVIVLALLFLLNLLLRVFYLRYDFLNGDEGVRALSAIRMLEGARLYADIVTDKPPGASLCYAAIFAAFGRSMKAVHLAATVWNFGTSLAVYLIAARLYGKRMALLAALLFVYFSTNYFTQDVMAANDELLMSLPYAGAFYFFIRARAWADSKYALGSAIAAGLLTGVASMFKQVGVLNLVFFALYEAWRLIRALKSGDRSPGVLVRDSIARLLLIGCGFAAVLVCFVFWLAKLDSLGDFWRNGIILNRFYVDAVPWNLWVRFLLGRGLGYVVLNGSLWLLAGWAVLHALSERTRQIRDRCEDKMIYGQPAAATQLDLALAMWCGVTLVGVAVGGRFFGHYFILAVPALSLLGARGALLLWRLRESPDKVAWKTAAGVLAALFATGLFRSHHRTAVLAYETITGSRTRWSAAWGMTRRQQEAKEISEFVRSRIKPGEPLYIWGYAHDVYWQTGCSPASRYLTPYYIDGRFVDVEGDVSESGEDFRNDAAANLIEDLRSARPRLILDVYSSIRTIPHPALVDFILMNYRNVGAIGPEPERPFRVFELAQTEASVSERGVSK